MSDQHTELYAAHAARESSHLRKQEVQSLSPFERAILREHEPDVQFEIAEVPGITPGRQSRVTILRYRQNKGNYDVVFKRMGAGKGLSQRAAHEMRDRLIPYRESLLQRGWRVPKVYFSQVVDVVDEHQIFSYEEYIAGGDGRSLLVDPSMPNFRKWFLIEEVLRQLYSYDTSELKPTKIDGQHLTILPHGLDLKSDNVVLEQLTEKLYFVDLFGPKEIVEEGGLFRWDIYSPKLDSLNPTSLLAVCATREGLVLRFWRLARRQWEPTRKLRRSLQPDFLDLIASLNPPPREIDFLAAQLRDENPWLNAVYNELAV